VERALLEFVRRADDDLTLFMERLDDFELQSSGSALEILQAKHHVGSGGDLSDKSVDLWRSLAVWMDIWPGTLGTQAEYVVLTTGSVPTGSATELLRDEGRDVPGALSLLEAAARSSENQETDSARREFLALLDADRLALVWSVHVRGAEPHIGEIDEALSEALRLRLTLAAPQHQAYLDRLKAWWYREAVRMLNDPSLGIATDDLVRFLQGLRDSFHPEDLPLAIGFEDPSDVEIATYQASVFVTQLKWIAYTNEQLNIAIRDYHRAYAERSRWAREGILRPGELDQYERRLVEQWQRVFADMVGEIAQGSGDEDRERAGRELLQSLRDSTAVPLRPRYSEVFMTHGSLHGLADDRRVGWHPEFQARLEELLAAAS
jgi:hypothetical protein